MVDVKPDEISAILKQQLSGFSSATELEEYGTVLQVGDGIARVYGLTKAQAGELVEFDNGTQAIVLNLEEDNVGVVLMGSSDGIREGSRVKRTSRIASIKVGEGFVGRVVNALGEPIDGKGAIEGTTYEMPLERKAPGVIYRQPVNEPLQTGIKSIDAMIPIGRGQRELIIGDRQTGKTAIAIDTIINQREFYERGEPVFCIYVASGRKPRLLLTWPRHWKTTARWTTPSSFRLQQLTLRHYSSMHHLQALRLESTSVIPAALH